MHGVFHWVLSLLLSWDVALVLLLLADLLALITVPSILFRRQGHPVAALAWILAVVALPYVGVLSWWTLGRSRIPRLRRLRRESTEELCACSEGSEERSAGAEEGGPDVLALFGDGNRWQEGVFPSTTGNRIELLVDGETAFPAIEDAIREATEELSLLFYIWTDDGTGSRLAELLRRKAREGVRVRLLVDAVGSPGVRGRFLREVEDAGVEVARFLPARFRPWNPTFNFRNHRKLVVVDRRTAFVGGMNVAEEYERDYHDLMARVEGPAVAHLHEVFREDWFFVTGQDAGEADPADVPAPGGEGATTSVRAVASGPDHEENRIHDAFLQTIYAARDRLLVTTPYLVPSSEVKAALRGAAQRGVDVRILVPRRSDIRLVGFASRSYYGELLRAGVRIFEYDAGFLHAKIVVRDDRLSVVGSVNVDCRSFRLNFELACFLDDPEVNGRLADLFAADLARSEEVTGDPFEDQPLVTSLAELVAHLVSPLL